MGSVCGWCGAIPLRTSKQPYGLAGREEREKHLYEIDFVWNFNTSNYLNINHSPLWKLFTQDSNRTYLNNVYKNTKVQNRNNFIASRTCSTWTGVKKKEIHIWRVFYNNRHLCMLDRTHINKNTIIWKFYSRKSEITSHHRMIEVYWLKIAILDHSRGGRRLHVTHKKK